MKKLITLLLFAVVVSFTSTAQTSLVSQYSNTVDTVTDAGTKYLTVPAAVKGFQKTVSVNLYTSKISGTVAGTATLQYSLDGTNYYALPKDSVYTLTNVSSQSFGWQFKDWGDLYLRIKFVGSGTMANKIYAKVLFRKENQ